MSKHRKLQLDTLYSHCTHEGDCWLWQGYCTGAGTPYGHLHGKHIAVRRAVLLLQGHPPLTGQQIASTHCGEGLCVNPAHIRVTTRKALLNQLRRSGAINDLRRVQSIAASKRLVAPRLTIEQARALRADPRSALQIERDTGISHTLVSKVRRGEMWREIVASPWAGLGARR